MMKKRYTLPEAINSDQELSVDETRLKDLELRKGQKFTYLFDFGDMWWFDIKVLAIQEGSVEKPMLIKAVNDAPEQYPMYEEEVENCKAEISSHGSFRSRWSG